MSCKLHCTMNSLSNIGQLVGPGWTKENGFNGRCANRTYRDLARRRIIVYRWWGAEEEEEEEVRLTQGTDTCPGGKHPKTGGGLVASCRKSETREEACVLYLDQKGFNLLWTRFTKKLWCCWATSVWKKNKLASYNIDIKLIVYLDLETLFINSRVSLKYCNFK